MIVTVPVEIGENQRDLKILHVDVARVILQVLLVKVWDRDRWNGGFDKDGSVDSTPVLRLDLGQRSFEGSEGFSRELMDVFAVECRSLSSAPYPLIRPQICRLN